MKPIFNISASFLAVLLIPAYALSNTTRSCQERLIGVNMAGPEFSPGKLPGTLGQDYKFPRSEQLRYYASVGFDSIRLPILWERVQPQLMADLDIAYMREIKSTIKAASGAGLKVVIDLHNSARYGGVLIGSDGVPNTSFHDVWVRLTKELRDMPEIVGWGLMNEPYRTGGTWAKVAQVGVTAVRENDSSRMIFVAGDSFSSAERWASEHAQPFVQDPKNKVVYEAHVYLDSDASGKYQLDTPEYVGLPRVVAERRLKPFVEWLRHHGQRGVIGEYGVPATESAWFDGISALLDIAEKECMSTFVWAGGAWSPGYKLSLEPQAGQDKPLTGWFRARLQSRQGGVGISR